MGYANMSDEAIFTALQRSNKAAFAHIYLKYYDKLCKYVYSLSNHNAHAEDIAQETLLSLWEKRATLRKPHSLNSYLYKCAYNNFVNNYNLKVRKKSLIASLREEAILELEFAENDFNQERLSIIFKIIGELPQKRQKIFVLNKLNNYKYKEIAIMQNISERTVESQIRKAMITIREKVAELQLTGALPFIILFLLA
ncbi:RNA polymerase sigma factor [uncultured Croceitalea sp.]|uniref:RNA polymerase sigma factor n=1 Tax=uncultured Croceitalea sp. TaxID=1798908 RepID=UPI00374EF191